MRQWTGIERGVALALVQMALVLSVAGKYLYDRKTSPRVWTRTAQVDPNRPLRGRYLALQLAVDGCGLPKEQGQGVGPGLVRDRRTGLVRPAALQWQVRPQAREGRLVVVSAEGARPEDTDEVTVGPNASCERARLGKMVDYFIRDDAKGPFPLQAGEELWVEVTVPPSGPPRPIQLAVSKDGVFRVLRGL